MIRHRLRCPRRRPRAGRAERRLRRPAARSDSTPRHGGRLAAALLLAVVAGVSASGCRSAGEDAGSAENDLATRVVVAPQIVPPTAIVRGTSAPASLPTQGAVEVSPLPAGEVVPVAAVSTTVAFEDGVEARPGAWSPDGRHLLAFVLDAGDAPSEADLPARVWTVDAEAARPLWDSGDMVDRLGRATEMADWRADGTLVLARADGPLVSPDGDRAAEVEGIEGQPRSLTIGPDRTLVFMAGPDGAWLVDGRQRARPVYGGPHGGFDAWSWHPDGTRLAAVGPAGGYYIIDAGTGEATNVADETGMVPGRKPAPRWLVGHPEGDRILVTDAEYARASGGAVLDHRLVETDGSGTFSLPGMVEVPLSVALPYDASTWVSPDGAFVVYPETEPVGITDEGAPTYRLVRSWLIDFGRGQARPVVAMTDPVWSPDGRRIAYRDGDSLVVFDLDDGAAAAVAAPEAGLARYAWSAGGRWLLLTDPLGALWMVSADGMVGPSRLAAEVAWAPGPTWSPDESRFAVTVVDPDGLPRLTVFAMPGGR